MIALTDVNNNVKRTYENDAWGVLTGGTDVTTFEWFADNKLKKVVRNGNSSWFYYDASGRIARIGGYGWKRFYWLGGNLLAQLNWNATSKDAEYSYYGADNLHAVRVGTTNYFAHSDGAGNVIALTDQSDVVKRTYEYGEWGELVGGTDNVNFFEKDRARFKGAMWENVSGLYFMRNRWYEPQSGRFMSEDPIGLAGGINPYSFAANNPITFRDPTGLAPCAPDDQGTHSHGTVLNRKTGESREQFHNCAKQNAGNFDATGSTMLFDPDCVSGRGASEITCAGFNTETDVCDTYRGVGGSLLEQVGRGIIGGICRRVYAPGKDGVNQATAECLASQWPGGELTVGEMWEYLGPGHRQCYGDTDYVVFPDFVWDLGRQAGTWKRYWPDPTSMFPRPQKR